MAHCDSKMTDLGGEHVPRGPGVVLLARDSAPDGSGKGLGCSSNGAVVACSYKNLDDVDAVVVYNASGSRLWASGTHLSGSSHFSAPLVSASGDVVAADDRTLARFTPSGGVAWSVSTAGGTPISPVIGPFDTILLATAGGPLSVHRSSDGQLLGSLTVTTKDGLPYETGNTPCVIGNRMYVSMHQRAAPHFGALVAVDVRADSAPMLKVAWTHGFGGPSGASPLCHGDSVHFDAAGLTPGTFAPHVIGLRDLGTGPELLYAKPTTTNTLASFALDPRGDGYWVMPNKYRFIEKRSFLGEVVDSLDVPVLVGDAAYPNIGMSAITMFGSSINPAMVVGTTDLNRVSAHVLAIDLVTRSRLWKFKLSDVAPDRVFSQFSVVLSEDKPRVVFPGTATGAYFLGVR